MTQIASAGKPVITMESLGFNMTPNAASNEWRKQKSILLGPSKCGKTSFLAEAGDKMFFFRTEAGHNHVSTIGADIRDFDDFITWKTKLMQAKASGVLPFESVAIDTGDRFIDIIDESVIAWANQKYKREFESIGDIAEGIGWFVRQNKILQVLKQLEELNCHIFLVFHVTGDVRKDEMGKDYKRDTINVGGKAGNALLAWADHVLHIRTAFAGDIMVRKLYTRGSKTLEAGTRMKTMPPVLTWKEDNKENYKDFRALFS